MYYDAYRVSSIMVATASHMSQAELQGSIFTGLRAWTFRLEATCSPLCLCLCRPSKLTRLLRYKNFAHAHSHTYARMQRLFRCGWHYRPSTL